MYTIIIPVIVFSTPPDFWSQVLDPERLEDLPWNEDCLTAYVPRLRHCAGMAVEPPNGNFKGLKPNSLISG